MKSKFYMLLKSQFDLVDSSPLIVFRIIFGFLIFSESAGAIFTGWVNETFVLPPFTFTIIGLEWLQPLPGNGMYYYFGVMAILGLMVMIGYQYRFSISLFTILWTASYLMQKSNYNNHYYLLILICLFMCISPANGFKSVDAIKKPRVASLTCPRWCISIFKVQIWIVFTYAAIAKVYPGWMNGEFIELSFKGKANYPIIGSVLQEDWLQKMVVIGGILFDLLIVYGLIWKKTRSAAFIIAIVFHLFNSAVFQIGIFPYLMIALSVFFFNPDYIRRIFLPKKPHSSFILHNASLHNNQKRLVFVLMTFFLIQLTVPLRHYTIDGDVFWTEEGHRLSWRMMLRTKSGSIKFLVKNSDNDSTWVVNPGTVVSPNQARSMVGKPDMIWQFSQKLKEKYMLQGIENTEIYAQSRVRLNKGDFHSIIDENQNLATTKWERFKHSSWILTPPKE